MHRAPKTVRRMTSRVPAVRQAVRNRRLRDRETQTGMLLRAIREILPGRTPVIPVQAPVGPAQTPVDPGRIPVIPAQARANPVRDRIRPQATPAVLQRRQMSLIRKMWQKALHPMWRTFPADRTLYRRRSRRRTAQLPSRRMKAL